MNLFGFEIKRKHKNTEDRARSFIAPTSDEGAIDVISGGVQSVFFDIDGSARSEATAISRYRMMMTYPEVQFAVDEIVNESVIVSPDEEVVSVITDDLELSKSVKVKIEEEFSNVLSLLNFSNNAYEIFMRWYIDGRINYHVILNDNPSKGIKELRYIDPRRIRKVREFEEEASYASNQIVMLKRLKDEYYIYNDGGFDDSFVNHNSGSFASQSIGLKISTDSIVHSNSGILNEDNTIILSHLDKTFKVLNQLKLMEDALVIYRISRAPERRVFYIDVGNLPKAKAEQYLRETMVNHKTQLEYDASTGEVSRTNRILSVSDDFWFPRREGGRGTQVETLQGGQSLGELDDLMYFKNLLFQSLNIPRSRIDQDASFTFGRPNEITRDEIKFSKFVQRLRARFSILFDEILERQLVLKKIISPDDWDEIRDKIRYNFNSDNHFEELKDAEILRERLSLLNEVHQFQGDIFSREWILKSILRLSDTEIDELQKQINKENTESDHNNEDDKESLDGQETYPQF